MICWIVRNLVIREKVVMIAIYKALIRPHLEVLCPIVESTCGSWKLGDCFGAGECPEAVYPSD